jgi:hypothetical protein
MPSKLSDRLIKQIASFLACWVDGKEEEHQLMAKELYWKAIHEELREIFSRIPTKADPMSRGEILEHLEQLRREYEK